MDQDLLLKTMAVFTGVAAVSLVIMMAMMIAIWFSINQVKKRSMLMMDRVEPLADAARRTLEQTGSESKEILANVRAITERGRTQMDQVDTLLTDLSENAKVQLARLDDTMKTTLGRVNETGEAVQTTIIQPIQRIRAVTAAVGAFADHLAGARRRTVDKATIDEEMFI